METVWIVTEYDTDNDDALIVAVCATEAVAQAVKERLRRRRSSVVAITQHPVITSTEE